jgi:hypothetical protein
LAGSHCRYELTTAESTSACPRCRKTFAPPAERLPGIMPSLEPAAVLEVSAIHSVAGALKPDGPLVTGPPFCAPHHTATKAAIVGGGSGVIRPGAASLAHHGCLFLDEAPELPGPVDLGAGCKSVSLCADGDWRLELHPYPRSSGGDI